VTALALAGPPAAEPALNERQELLDRIQVLETRVHAGEQRRRAMVHIMKDLAESNTRLANQRRAMLHILADYESDRKNLAQQKERLNNSRRALMHILQDAHESNVRLGQSRKAMIHIMGDLRETTNEIGRREQELREKQEQLVQAAKLATLGELTTGIAHELNNPLNNIGLYLGNMLDRLDAEDFDKQRMEHNLTHSLQQVKKATEIINHLRTFGRAAPLNRETVNLNAVVENAISLLREQLRLHEIDLELELSAEDPLVAGNPIQLEQVVMNLLSNARDAVAESPGKRISISSAFEDDSVLLTIEDSGPGIDPELEQRIFDPFFTTKEVGQGTGLGLSIVYGIIKDHEGSISVESQLGRGARFVINLPRERTEA
jgi:C4-dicarboxylate-specific signal transduction histidine kinase